MRIGEVLKAYRDAQFWTVRKMADEIGIPSASYHRIEQGKTGDKVELETWIIITNWLAGK